MMLQEHLFQSALAEKGISASIRLNHIYGKTYVNDHEFGIKYPMAYINEIDNMSKEKKYEYCFLGKYGPERGKLLSKFISDNSVIKESARGRDTILKYTFDNTYYQTICNTKYSLCPNQGSDSIYKHDYGWTYRLIESTFCKSVPIAFRKTPYGSKFIQDIKFLWDDDDHDLSDNEYEDIVEHNYELGLKYWTLQLTDLERIRSNELITLDKLIGK